MVNLDRRIVYYIRHVACFISAVEERQQSQSFVWFSCIYEMYPMTDINVWRCLSSYHHQQLVRTQLKYCKNPCVVDWCFYAIKMESMACGFILWEIKFVAACVALSVCFSGSELPGKPNSGYLVSRPLRKSREISGLANVDGLLLWQLQWYHPRWFTNTCIRPFLSH